jgi:hypothetical protein
MKTALEAQISPENIIPCNLSRKVIKTEGSCTSDANSGITHPISLTIKINTAEEALRMHSWGYISTDTLIAAGVAFPQRGSEEFNELQIKAIQKAVKEYFGFTPEQLTVKNRREEPRFARQFSMYLIWKHTENLSLKKIGSIYSRDHSTVIHSVDVIIDFMTQVPDCYEKSTINNFLSTYNFEYE